MNQAARPYFNPRPPYGGRRAVCAPAFEPGLISIHALHTEGDYYLANEGLSIIISIHALHTEGDEPLAHALGGALEISIHALHTEGDAVAMLLPCSGRQFQSTPSIRRATRCLHVQSAQRDISIHALHTEGDAFRLRNRQRRASFQSTPSIRRATAKTAKPPCCF